MVVQITTATEWTQYRGPNHDGTSTDRITRQWSGSATNPIWLVPLTNGLSSLTISDGRVFTQVARNTNGANREICVALNATNGSVLWSTDLDLAYYPNGGVGLTDDGPRTTPIVSDGSVFVLTSYLKLYRLNATNGAILWSTNLISGFGGSAIAWQNAASPVLEDGLLFVNANCSTSTLMAFHVADGTLAWRSQDEPLTHSTPVLATLHGVRQLIFATQTGLVSVHPQTGALLWKFPYPFSYLISLGSSPVVYDDVVFITGFYTMGAVAARVVDTGSLLVATQLWRNASIQSHWATPVSDQGYLYGQFTPDNADAELRCLDGETGDLMWAAPGFGRGSTLLVGTNLVVITERGDLVLVSTSPGAFEELGRFRAIPAFSTDGNKCWNALAISDGRVYVRSTAYAACYDLSVPDLQMDPPQLDPPDQLQLTIRTVTGASIPSNRVSGITVRASTNATLPVANWPQLTNTPLLTNGVARITTIDAGLPSQFFIVSEPE